jgi:hypothetical protein
MIGCTLPQVMDSSNLITDKFEASLRLLLDLIAKTEQTRTSDDVGLEMKTNSLRTRLVLEICRFLKENVAGFQKEGSSQPIRKQVANRYRQTYPTLVQRH